MRQQPTPLTDLSAFQRDLLATVAARDGAAGLHFAESLEEHRDRINNPRLYDNLDALVGHGLVEKSELDKRTNSYELTDDGREALLSDIEWRIEQVEG